MAAFNGELLDFCIPVNLHFPPDAMIQLVHERLSEILRYYPDYTEVHQQNISEMTGLPPETIVPANGSTEIITRLCQQAEGPIVTEVPTFSRWADLPEELDLSLHTLVRKRANRFELEVDEIVMRVREVRARTLVICNPNNPTGAWLTIQEIKQLALSLPDLDTVIIDESFIDFADPARRCQRGRIRQRHSQPYCRQEHGQVIRVAWCQTGLRDSHQRARPKAACSSAFLEHQRTGCVRAENRDQVQARVSSKFHASSTG